MSAAGHERLAALDDTQLLALCIWGEARGESVTGQLAVAHVVLNRAASPRWWGHDVRSVILKKWQFSYFNSRSPGPGLVQLAIAELAMGKLTLDPTLGATHYHAVGVTPDWTRLLRHVVDIGRHRFYVE
jgi:N-acetylmuramoyl-L-alanine amidase